MADSRTKTADIIKSDMADLLSDWTWLIPSEFTRMKVSRTSVRSSVSQKTKRTLYESR